MRTDHDAVEAKIDQDGNIVIQLKPEWRCKFTGSADVYLEGATGITRNPDNFDWIDENDRYDIEKFSVKFVKTGKECCPTCEPEDLHLTFKMGQMYIQEGDALFETEYVYELERYIYVKEGKTTFYPTNKGVTNCSRRRPPREATCHLTPVFHDDAENLCNEWDDG